MDNVDTLSSSPMSDARLAECPYRVVSGTAMQCGLAARWSDLKIEDCEVTVKGCLACSIQSVPPETPNEVVAIIALRSTQEHAPNRVGTVLQILTPYLRLSRVEEVASSRIGLRQPTAVGFRPNSTSGGSGGTDNLGSEIEPASNLVKGPFDSRNEGRQPRGQDLKTSTSSAETGDLSTEEMYKRAATTPWMLNEDTKQLKNLAAQCEMVVEFGQRCDISTIALLAGQPQRMLSIAPFPSVKFFELAGVKGRTRLEYLSANSLSAEIPLCDLLFIDTKHNGLQLWAEFQRHQAKATRFIVVSHTHTYGQRGEDGGLGLMRAVERLIKQFPRWRVISHHPAGQGLTVLSCRSEDFLTPSPQLWPAANGPGTELKRLLASVGVNPAPSCDCNGRARMMDQWGPAVCRQRIEEIVGWMREGQARWGWKEKLSATAKAVANGLVFKLNPLDPFPSLIEEAIRQSEIKQQQDAAITSEP